MNGPKRSPQIPEHLCNWFQRTPKAVLAELVWDMICECESVEWREGGSTPEEQIRWLEKRQNLLASEGVSIPHRKETRR